MLVCVMNLIKKIFSSKIMKLNVSIKAFWYIKVLKLFFKSLVICKDQTLIFYDIVYIHTHTTLAVFLLYIIRGESDSPLKGTQITKKELERHMR